MCFIVVQFFISSNILFSLHIFAVGDLIFLVLQIREGSNLAQVPCHFLHLG